MKKSYIYFLAPIIGVLIFGVIYWNFSSKYALKEEQLILAEKKARLDKKEKADKDRLKAYEEAVAGSKKAKDAKEAREKKDAKDVEDRQLAIEQRNKATREASTLATKIDRLNKDVEAIKKENAGIEDDKKKARDEQAFLVTYVKQATDNANSLQSVLQKIKEADDAAIAAAKAAAEAAAAAAKAKK